MGADFIFEYVAIKQGKEEETIKKLFKAIEKFNIPELSKDNIKNTKIKILNSLNGTYSKEIEEFDEFWESGLNKDFTDNGLPLDDSPENDNERILTNERAKEVMKNVVEELFDCINNRDIGYFNHKGDTIYISGGMSYGDNPTDSFDIINRFNKLPLKILKAGKII